MLTSYVQQNQINLQCNGTTISDTKNTTFNKASFYAARDSFYYLLLYSDILGNMVDLIHEKGGRI